MIIISKFKDYYDTAQKFRDEGGVKYIRTTESTDSKLSGYQDNHIYKVLNPIVNLPHPQTFTIRNSGRIYHETLYPISIFVCGKKYNGMYHTHYQPGQLKPEKLFVYSYESYKETVEKLTGVPYNPEKKEKRRFFYLNTSIPEFFKQNQDEFNDILIENKIVTASVYISDSPFEGTIYSINPCLKEFQFFKVIEPFTAHQEIDMFVSGVIANSGMEMPKMSDSIKIESHGFDKKWSFRKQGKNK